LSIDRSESLLILAVHFRGRLCWPIQQADSAGRKAASQTNKNNTPPIRVSMMEAAFCRDFSQIGTIFGCGNKRLDRDSPAGLDIRP
jgi:hypothetical protein